MSIYTKKGDKGETGLFGSNRRCSKNSLVFQAIGAIDELNSFLGIVVSVSEDQTLRKELKVVQRDLLTIGSILGGSSLRFTKVKTAKIEKQIDKLEKKLPKLTNFILPGGSKTASHLHFARALARRAEREVVALSVIEDVKLSILVYLNRLSDYLFIVARGENYRVGLEEKVWRSSEKK